MPKKKAERNGKKTGEQIALPKKPNSEKGRTKKPKPRQRTAIRALDVYRPTASI
jgi:hypothetical protein